MYPTTCLNQLQNGLPGGRTLSLIDLFALIKQIHTSKRGVTVTEYAVIAGVVVIAIAALLKTIGPKLGNTFSTISGKLG